MLKKIPLNFFFFIFTSTSDHLKTNTSVHFLESLQLLARVLHPDTYLPIPIGILLQNSRMLLILQGTEQHVITKRKIIQNVSSTENRNITVSCVFASEFLSLWMSKSKHTLPSHFKHLNFPMPKCSQKMCSFLSFSSVQFSCSVMSYFLPPHGLQQARVPVHQQLPELTQTHVH